MCERVCASVSVCVRVWVSVCVCLFVCHLNVIRECFQAIINALEKQCFFVPLKKLYILYLNC